MASSEGDRKESPSLPVQGGSSISQRKKTTGSMGDNRRCHKCGKFGHLVARCDARSGSAAGKIEEGVQQMHDQLEGNKVALQDAVRQLKEKEGVERELERIKAQVSGAMTAADLALRQRCEKIDVRVKIRTWNAHIVITAMVGVLFLIAGGLMTRRNYRAHDLDAIFVGSGIAIFVVSIYQYVTQGAWLWLHLRFKSWLQDPEVDRRADMHSLQKVRHMRPHLALFEMRRTDAFRGQPRDLRVSCELLAQILSGANVAYNAQPLLINERLYRAAVGNQTVNVPRDEFMQSVHSQTATAAWVIYLHQEAGKLLDFAMRPHQ